MGCHDLHSSISVCIWETNTSSATIGRRRPQTSSTEGSSSFRPDYQKAITRSRNRDLIIITSGSALSGFALSGAKPSEGITNTAGAVPGIVGVALTDNLLDSTHLWSESLFAPSIFFCLTSTVVWLLFASSKPQTFSKRD